MTICEKPGKSRKEDELIAALLMYPTIGEAAASCGVHINTVSRWLADEGFAARYKTARKAVLSAAMNRLAVIAATAVETLRTVMEDAEAPSSSRVSAARTTLEMIIKVAEIEELSERLDKLEAAVGGGRTHGSVAS